MLASFHRHGEREFKILADEALAYHFRKGFVLSTFIHITNLFCDMTSSVYLLWFLHLSYYRGQTKFYRGMFPFLLTVGQI